MTKKKIKEILDLLDALYPTQDKCYLNYTAPYELLFATILSAQCTDDRVNEVTPALFAKYPTLQAFAEADLADMEQAVRTTGFYHNKAKNIIGAAQMLLTVYQSEMPQEVEKLTAMPGVGRKTANVVRSHIFHLPSIVVDTHVKRISGKLGLTKNTDPTKVEYDLMKILPKEHWIRFNTQVIAHGRSICKAQKPKCDICGMNAVCEYYNR